MTVDESNQGQADFWAAAGPRWAALRDRFDDHGGDHGVAAIDALDPRPGEHILDIGCGAGSSTMQLARRVGQSGSVIGFDISSTMIDGARELAAVEEASNVAFAVGDAMVERFEPVHDGIYSRFGVMFFSDPVRAFTNMRTALRPGGRLGFVCWQTAAQNRWASLPFEVLGRYTDLPPGAAPDAPGPFALGDRSRLESILSDAGFTDVAIEGRETPLRTGADLEDAVDFLFDRMPPATALRENDPATAHELRVAFLQELADWSTPDGVLAPSAVWVVTAVNPS